MPQSRENPQELVRQARAKVKVLLDKRTLMRADENYRINPHDIGLAATLIEELADEIERLRAELRNRNA